MMDHSPSLLLAQCCTEIGQDSLVSPGYLEAGLGHTHSPFPVPALVLCLPVLVIFALWNNVWAWLWASLQGFPRD